MNRLAIAILATVAAFPAGYGTHAYLHRHDAGEDFRRGREQGMHELHTPTKPKPPQPSYPAGGGQPK
jgi:hypothetical protein